MKKKTVVVGMSGGVDSSTACLLLKNEGYRVIGVTLKLWEPEDCNSDKIKGKSCCSPDDFSLARKVASQLGIPYYVLNFKKEFEKHVIQYFTREYLSGRTPNPCILCNQKIKFDLLLKKAREEFQADYLATGHYAQIFHNSETNEYELYKGKDIDKDQSYFLWGLNQENMRYIIFPVGSYTKKEIRKIASSTGLIVADKRDSQEICFIPDNNYGKFLLNYKKLKNITGQIVDINGKILGKHRGLFFYTVGQRKGLGIYSPDPLYVIKIDKENNLLVVGDNQSLYSDKLEAEDIIWCGNAPSQEGVQIKVKIRSRSVEAYAKIFPYDNNKAHLIFTSPQRAITPGQAVVFYNEDKLIGGGWIK